MIKFPKMHIAESVVNRIMNVADGLPDRGSSARPPTPRAPKGAQATATATQSAVLNAKLSRPVSDALPGIDRAPDPGATASGDPLIDTILDPES